MKNPRKKELNPSRKNNILNFDANDSFFLELTKINNINNRKDTELLNAIEFHYYSKSYTNKKEENKEDNKGIKLIKEFVETLYREMT